MRSDIWKQFFSNPVPSKEKLRCCPVTRMSRDSVHPISGDLFRPFFPFLSTVACSQTRKTFTFQEAGGHVKIIGRVSQFLFILSLVPLLGIICGGKIVKTALLDVIMVQNCKIG